MATRRKIELTEERRDMLERFVKTGKRSVHLVKRAQVILELDTAGGRRAAGRADISSKTGLSKTAISDIKEAWFESGGTDEFLKRKKRATPPVEAKITGDVQAHIIALACTEPPEGYARWTLQLLASKSVELSFIDSISNVSVGNVLKKINFSPAGTNIGASRLNKTQNS